MKRGLAILVCCWALPLAAADLNLCQGDTDAYPWSYGNEQGLDQYVVKTAARNLKLQINLQARPWKRCLHEVSTGLSDGVLSASFTAEREKYAAYPRLPDGRPDSAFRLSRDYYRVYRRINSPMNWQGGQFHQVQSIGIQAGYSVGEKLRADGFTLDERSKEAIDLLRKLDAGVIDIAITEQGEAGQALRKNPGLARHIEMLPLPYEVDDQYLAMNKAFCQKKPALCQALWQEIRKVRESKPYQQKLQQHGF